MALKEQVSSLRLQLEWWNYGILECWVFFASHWKKLWTNIENWFQKPWSEYWSYTFL